MVYVMEHLGKMDDESWYPIEGNLHIYILLLLLILLLLILL